MKLADYLSDRGAKVAFAAKTGLSPGYITALCDGRSWPSRAVARLIFEHSEGNVSPDDFAGIIDGELDDEPTRARA